MKVLLITLIVALVYEASAAQLPGDARHENKYAINLISTRESLPDLEDVPKEFVQSHTAYITRFEKDGASWHRLRLGFFSNRQQAKTTATELHQYFPNAWVTPATAEEIQLAKSSKTGVASSSLL